MRIPTLLTHVQAGWQHPATLENIGLGGARVGTDRPLALGDRLTLSMAAPTLWDPLVLAGRVVWIAPSAGTCAAGVAFEHEAPDAVFALYELIVTLGYE